jgi:hypothetical protein
MKTDLLKIVFVLAIIATFSGSAFAQSANSDTSSMDERIAKSKNTLKLQLNAAQSQKISQNCVAAQGLIKNILSTYKITSTKRQETYSALSTQLTTDIRMLQTQGENISSLKTAQEQFDAAITKYTTDSASYKTALDDTVAMDCSKDPVGFKALLTSARQLKPVMASDAGQIKIARDELVQALDLEAKNLKTVDSGVKQ